MARAKKSNPSGKKTTASAKRTNPAETDVVDTVAEAAEDAQIADTTPEDPITPEEAVVEQAAGVEETGKAQDKETPEDPQDSDAVESKSIEEVPAEETGTDADQKPAETAMHPVPVPVEAEKSSGFWPLVFGGLVAGGIGFAVSELDLLGGRDPGIDLSRLTSEVQDQNARIASLEEATPDTGPIDALKSEIAAVQDTVAGLDETLTGYADRLTALEDRPIAISAETGEADAYAEELARLQVSIKEQQASIEAQRSEIQGLLDNALSVEEAAAKAAKASAAQAAFARLTSAVASGESFEGPVEELQSLGGIEVPDALVNNASGVVTLADLQARFPDTSRAALAAARASAPEEESGGLGGFLKRQLGARSVSPREGSDADAVLSRAEDAVRNGRLSDAIAEIVTLPAVAQDAMQDWLADAEARDTVRAAADTLAQRLTAN